MKQFLLTTLVGLGTWGWGSAQSESPVTREGGYWVRTIQGNLDTSASDRLRVDTVGNVMLHGEPVEQGRYTLTLRVRAGDARSAATEMDQISVKAGAEGGWTYLKVGPPWAGRANLTLTVTAPKALRQVKVQTAGGKVQASDWNGELQARTAGGEIVVDHIGGPANVETGGGTIQVGSVTGSFKGDSGGGSIRVK